MAAPQIPGTAAHAAACDQELAELRQWLARLREAYPAALAAHGPQDALRALGRHIEQGVAASIPPGIPMLDGYFVAAVALTAPPTGCTCGGTR